MLYYGLDSFVFIGLLITEVADISVETDGFSSLTTYDSLMQSNPLVALVLEDQICT